jgi:uncharacterized integral membrane protein
MTSEPPQDIRPADATATPQDQGGAPVTPPDRGVKRARSRGAWVAAGFSALILLLLLIFILQNTHRVDITYFGVHVHAPLGVALFFAAVLGALVVGILAIWRIIQLRTAAHRRRR